MKNLLIGLFLASPALLFAEPVVSLAGVQIVYDSAAKDFDGFKIFNMDKGNSVTLLVRSPDQTMVGFNDKKASVTIGGAKGETKYFMSSMSFSQDNKALKLEFSTDDKVQANAEGKLEIKGTLPVIFATGKAEVKSNVFQAKEGEAIVFGDGEDLPTLKIDKTGKPSFGDDPFEIEFSTNKKMDTYTGVRFLTKDGKEIATRGRGSSWMGFGTKGSGTVTYSLAEKHDELIFVLETWTGRQEKSVVVDLKADWSGK